jgi:5-methylcytosine-specific restriction endonuclease McrA
MAGFRPVGPASAKTVAKVRRTKVQAYGTVTSWAATSAAVLKRDGRRCTKCGRGSTPGNHLNAHHIIPISRGGKTVMFNLTTVCESCHRKQPFHSHMQRQYNQKKIGRA